MSSLGGWLLNDLGPAASLVAIGGAVFALYRAAARVYSRTTGSRRNLARRLNRLAAGMTLPYVEELFGTPIFSRAFPNRITAVPSQRKPSMRGLVRRLADPDALALTSPSGPTATGIGQQTDGVYRELLFREKHAWIQVIIDQHDAIARFSITVTDPRFKFQIRDLTHGQIAAKLGHSRFADVITNWGAEGRSLRIGAHNHEYAEAYYAGYPGFYQRFAISHSEVGTGDFGYAIEHEGPSFCREGTLDFAEEQPPVRQQFDPAAEYAQRFRTRTTVNTLTVLGPNSLAFGLAEPRGPDSGQVWVVVPGRREQISRRMRQVKRQLAPRALHYQVTWRKKRLNP